ncbi:GNAT family N-acetyltransferase [Nocardioides luteus]|uniref:GNAT family N-acetyltransferase n=1 Tax=Nocardioides luteus TaxID=1844 RepID=UPI0018CA07A3|nr:GNAT family N-acetyltransferase [Nocardioides luteus]MBG6095943.1 GNAT superfamily N-acetyltransferase [Nocardioides luteus]
MLKAYDEQLRTDAETPGAVSVTRHGPLRLITFDAGRGFISYQDLGGADEAGIEALVAAAVAHFEADPTIEEVEWKTRGHDVAPGLHETLLRHGFEPEEPESIMIGEARLLAVDVPLPDGIVLRPITSAEDVRAAGIMQDGVFGSPTSAGRLDDVVRRIAAGECEMWVAEADGEIVSAGRIDPVPSTEFAGIWGGATLPEWRGRGIYRALTAARARTAIARGKRYIHSDSTEFSRPILERSGLVKVGTTTPYVRRFG